jgi:hypothetical protein
VPAKNEHGSRPEEHMGLPFPEVSYDSCDNKVQIGVAYSSSCASWS